MKRYWARILIGALAVFAVGMVAVTFTRKGIHSVKTIVESSDPLSIPIAFVGFKMDGAKIGEIKRVTLLRDSPDVVRAVDIAVDLTAIDSAAAPHCFLVVDQMNGVDRNTSFRCGTTADTAGGKYQEFGAVTFRQLGVSVPLFLPESVVRDFRDHGGSGKFVPPEQVAPPPAAAGVGSTGMPAPQAPVAPPR